MLIAVFGRATAVRRCLHNPVRICSMIAVVEIVAFYIKRYTSQPNAAKPDLKILSSRKAAKCANEKMTYTAQKDSGRVHPPPAAPQATRAGMTTS